MSIVLPSPAQGPLTGGASSIVQLPALKPPVRCDSCDWRDETLSSPAENRVPLDRHAFGDLAAASRKQLQWDQVMCNELKVAPGYKRICVLLIHWEENDWLENTKKEIHDLKTIFQDGFGYIVQDFALRSKCSCEAVTSCTCSVQNRLDRAVTGFFRAHGGVGNEDNLVILYHTGHGYYDPHLKHLELSGLQQKDEQDPPPKVIWDHTELEFTEVARCDILAIMDSCMAGGVSSIIQGNIGRTYEYLAPSKAQQPTNAPGEKSFTRALINSLQYLLEEKHGQPFTTADLQEVISKQKRKGKGYGFLITRSSYNSRRIELRPMKEDPAYFDNSKVHAYLNLRLELKQDDLDEEELKELAKLMSRAVRDAKVATRRIDLLSLEARPPLSLRNVVKQTMSMRQGLSALGIRSASQAIEEENPAQPQLDQPGLYARFVWMSSNLRPHDFTIILQRPWSWMFVGGMATMFLFRILRRSGLLKRLISSLWR